MTTQIGLSAANFLLMAEGHLVKAREKLRLRPTNRDIDMAVYCTTGAIKNLRAALGWLDEQKEEPCKP